jgi:hypothetical protein
MMHSANNHYVILYYHRIAYIINNSYYSGVTGVPPDPNGVGELQITEAPPAVFGSDGCMGHCPDQGVRLHASLE